MSIPDYQTLMEPVLRVLDREGVLSVRELANTLATDLTLTPEDRQQTTTSGTGLLENRAHWSVTYLFKAGAVVRPQRGHVEITARGRGLLQSGEPIRNSVLQQFPEYQAFMAKHRKPAASDKQAAAPTEMTPDQAESPDDLIGRAVDEARAALADELLTKVRTIDPAQFERLVLKLLRAMGYGKFRVEHSGRPGDAGIDGIVSQDPLGLDRIYVQAKRYAADNVVHRPAIQGFVGALMGAQGDRGVFITTSSYSRGAAEEAERVNARIVLIDGDRLAELMIDHGVGVEAERVATLHRIDEDYFEEL